MRNVQRRWVFLLSIRLLSICFPPLSTAVRLSPEDWQDSPWKCYPCRCTLTRPHTLEGSPLVKYVNCSGLFLDELPANLPDDTEYLDVSRDFITSIPSSDSHFSGGSLMYSNLPDKFINSTSSLHKLKYLDLKGNSFNQFNSSHFQYLEFQSGIFGLEVYDVSSGTFEGLANLANLELRTPMMELTTNLFLHLKTSHLELHLENTQTLPGSIFNPMNTSLKSLTIFGDRIKELPENLLDDLLLLQSFRLVAPEMDHIPEHLLHGSSLFRSLNLEKEIPYEMWILLHSASSTRYLRDITLEGIKHLSENVFQYIPYLESISIEKTQDLEPNLFQRLVRLNELNLVDNNISDIKTGWFKDLGGLKVLNLSNNAIQETKEEDFQNLHSLEVFDLSHNSLENVTRNTFDSFRSGIEELHLDSNNLGWLEAGVFSEMWSLKELHLDHNHIDEINPSAFSDLHKLTSLTLNGNQIGQIEEGSLDNLQELKSLDLSANQIESIPDGLFSNTLSLQSVNLSENSMEYVSPGLLDSHFWLKDLDAGANPLHCDCALGKMVDTHKKSLIAGKCSTPPKYKGMDISNLPTSAMCLEEEKTNPTDPTNTKPTNNQNGNDNRPRDRVNPDDSNFNPDWINDLSNHHGNDIDTQNTDDVIDGDDDDDENTRGRSNSTRVGSQTSSRRGGWTRTPWVIAVLALVSGLLFALLVIAIIKARGHLYPDNYHFNFSTHSIIQREEGMAMS